MSPTLGFPSAIASPYRTAGKRGPWLQIRHASGFQVHEYDAPIEGMAASLEGLRIAHLSDLHIKHYWSHAYDELIDRLRALEVDLVLVTGDIVDDRRGHAPAFPHVKRLLKSLPSRLGVYTILGNHDNLRLKHDLELSGIPVLYGDREVVETGRGALELIGTPMLMRHHYNPGFVKRFERPTAGVPRIVMCHFPDFFPKLKVLEPDLYLCGHTHGGQVCLPWGGPIIRHDSSPRHLCLGAHRLGKTHYIVNRGFGFSGLDVRLFCPAEVILITLRGAEERRGA